MGCHVSKTQSPTSINSFKKNCKRTRITEFEAHNKDDEIGQELFNRKRGSRLSGTRNSLIMAKKAADSYIDHSNSHGVHQSQQFHHKLDFEQEGDKVALEGSPENPLCNHVHSFQIQANFLRQISQICKIQLYQQCQFDEQPSSQWATTVVIGTEQQKSKIHYKSNSFVIPFSELPQQKQLSLFFNQKNTSYRKKEILDLMISHIGRTQTSDQQQEINTLYSLIENIQFGSLNFSAIIWMLKKRLKEDGINLTYEQKSIIGEQNVFKFSNLYMLSANLSQSYWQLELRGSNYRLIFGQKLKKQQFLDDLEKNILRALTHFKDAQLIWVDILIVGDTFSIQFYLPYLAEAQNQDFQRQCTNILKAQLPETFKTLLVKNVAKKINISKDQFDVWGNREFKTSNDLDDEESTKESIFHYNKPVGWKRFGLKKNDDNGPADPHQVVNVFLRVSMRAYKDTEDILSLIRAALDVGPNKDCFTDQECGLGIICSSNINNFLPCTNLSSVPLAYRAQPIQYIHNNDSRRLIVHNESRYYYIMLQAQIEGSKIRVPDNFNKHIFIVNDINSINLRGILIKEISEIEYQEAIKLIN